jgi:hypothetical protein
MNANTKTTYPEYALSHGMRLLGILHHVSADDEQIKVLAAATMDVIFQASLAVGKEFLDTGRTLKMAGHLVDELRRSPRLGYDQYDRRLRRAGGFLNGTETPVMEDPDGGLPTA